MSTKPSSVFPEQRPTPPGGSRRHVVAMIAATVAAMVTALAPAAGPAQQSTTDPRPRGQASARVTGMVYDSVARNVLADVTVQFVAADDSGLSRGFSTRTDSVGRYALADVPPGRYLAGFFRTANDTLGIETSARVIDLRTGEQRIDLATPSPRTVIRNMCPEKETSDPTGLLIGHVRSADTDDAIVDASVVVEWAETVITGVVMEEFFPRLTDSTRGPGWFAICHVPSDVTLSARAAKGADSSGFIPVNVPADEVRHITFLLGGATVVPLNVPAARVAIDSSAAAPTVLRGQARLSGVVRDERGRPVENARALVWGTELEVVTNGRGTFTIDSLPGGTHTLEIRALRYAPVQSVVQLSARRPATIDVKLTERAAVLSTVTVKGTLVYSKQLAGLEERRADGWGMVGHFLTPLEIERRPATRLSGLLQGMSGVFVDNRRGGSTVRMRSSTNRNAYCTPSLYVDGTRDVTADFNDYHSDQIAGVEVYVRDSWRPMEFLDGNSCGAVAIWTRPAPIRRK